MEFELWQLEEERRYLRAMAEGREWYEEGEALLPRRTLGMLDDRHGSMRTVTSTGANW